MATATDIPVSVTPEAQARIKELGLEAEFQQILEHTKQAVPYLEAIEVETHVHEEEPDGEHIMIQGWRPGVSASLDDYRAEHEWGSWFVRTFPPQVVWWFLFFLLFRDEHGR